MKQHKAKAQWNGSLKEGNGEFETGRGNVKTGYSFASRFGDDTKATSPEELIGAAHAGCFSMFLSALVDKQNLKADYIKTNADVTLGETDGAPTILKIALTTEAKIPNMQDSDFQKLVKDAKTGCPVSKALASVPEITVSATLTE
ncbi:OsmC family peroxiredoxin [Pontibacter fetidus]|uniref:OsmC family peroxiredoxin n=1 Tax=Pontibacter fetidus TaxID=2700082 RepID=A0A6B2GUT7_9BACT|nr:OsmC family peroxiredoxin [Pontibacter fetidus]NDK54659.1 OsmC family peroxiredoxin [Pontibacter fetidus]